MSETYTIGSNAWQTLGGGIFAGQTFTPTEPHNLQFVDLKLWLNGYFSLPSVEIFLATPDHIPYGDCLSRDRFNYSQYIGYFGQLLMRFKMQPLLLTTGQNYAIIVKSDPPLPDVPCSWKYDQDAASYPGGMRILSTDSGASWNKYPDQDHFFCEIGAPPAPEPSMTPPIDHFTPMDIAFTPYHSDLSICIPTNTPCHLTLYYTDVEPQKHHTERNLRGLLVPWGTYFCFVAWKAVEQLEAGDTMYHTFWLPGWQLCQTKWFTVRGTVDDVQSPSVGPIFKYHHPGPVTHLFEHYITGDDNNTGGMGYGSYWFGQTFTPQITHTVNSVKLLAYRYGNPGLVTASIRATSFEKPFGSDLCSGTTNGNSLPTGSPYEWREIPLGSGTLLQAKTKYAIVLRSAGLNFSNRFICRLDASAPTYTRGQYVTSSTAGVSWLLNPPDLMFQEWYIA